MFRPFIKQSILRAHSLLKPALKEISIALVGDQTMSRLHRKFMGIDSPTDVLTFELDHDPRGRVLTGEVIVCVSQATRQSRRRGIPLKHEVLLYALHGMLHLCGFDDRTDRDFKDMHRKEDEILETLGFGRVFEGKGLKESRSK